MTEPLSPSSALFAMSAVPSTLLLGYSILVPVVLSFTFTDSLSLCSNHLLYYLLASYVFSHLFLLFSFSVTLHPLPLLSCFDHHSVKLISFIVLLLLHIAALAHAVLFLILPAYFASLLSSLSFIPPVTSQCSADLSYRVALVGMGVEVVLIAFCVLTALVTQCRLVCWRYDPARRSVAEAQLLAEMQEAQVRHDQWMVDNKLSSSSKLTAPPRRDDMTQPLFPRQSIQQVQRPSTSLSQPKSVDELEIVRYTERMAEERKRQKRESAAGTPREEAEAPQAKGTEWEEKKEEDGRDTGRLSHRRSTIERVDKTSGKGVVEKQEEDEQDSEGEGEDEEDEDSDEEDDSEDDEDDDGEDEDDLDDELSDGDIPPLPLSARSIPLLPSLPHRSDARGSAPPPQPHTSTLLYPAPPSHSTQLSPSQPKFSAPPPSAPKPPSPTDPTPEPPSSLPLVSTHAADEVPPLQPSIVPALVSVPLSIPAATSADLPVTEAIGEATTVVVPAAVVQTKDPEVQSSSVAPSISIPPSLHPAKSEKGAEVTVPEQQESAPQVNDGLRSEAVADEQPQSTSPPPLTSPVEEGGSSVLTAVFRRKSMAPLKSVSAGRMKAPASLLPVVAVGGSKRKPQLTPLTSSMEATPLAPISLTDMITFSPSASVDDLPPLAIATTQQDTSPDTLSSIPPPPASSAVPSATVSLDKVAVEGSKRHSQLSPLMSEPGSHVLTSIPVIVSSVAPTSSPADSLTPPSAVSKDQQTPAANTPLSAAPAHPPALVSVDQIKEGAQRRSLLLPAPSSPANPSGPVASTTAVLPTAPNPTTAFTPPHDVSLPPHPSPSPPSLTTEQPSHESAPELHSHTLERPPSSHSEPLSSLPLVTTATSLAPPSASLIPRLTPLTTLSPSAALTSQSAHSAQLPPSEPSSSALINNDEVKRETATVAAESSLPSASPPAHTVAAVEGKQPSANVSLAAVGVVVVASTASTQPSHALQVTPAVESADRRTEPVAQEGKAEGKTAISNQGDQMQSGSHISYPVSQRLEPVIQSEGQGIKKIEGHESKHEAVGVSIDLPVHSRSSSITPSTSSITRVSREDPAPEAELKGSAPLLDEPVAEKSTDAGRSLPSSSAITRLEGKPSTLPPLTRLSVVKPVQSSEPISITPVDFKVETTLNSAGSMPHNDQPPAIANSDPSDHVLNHPSISTPLVQAVKVHPSSHSPPFSTVVAPPSPALKAEQPPAHHSAAETARQSISSSRVEHNKAEEVDWEDELEQEMATHPSSDRTEVGQAAASPPPVVESSSSSALKAIPLAKRTEVEQRLIHELRREQSKRPDGPEGPAAAAAERPLHQSTPAVEKVIAAPAPHREETKSEEPRDGGEEEESSQFEVHHHAHGAETEEEVEFSEEDEATPRHKPHATKHEQPDTSTPTKQDDAFSL